MEANSNNLTADLSPQQIEDELQEIRRVYALFERVSKPMNDEESVKLREKRVKKGLDAGIDEAKAAEARAILEETVTDDYVFVDAFGHAYDKEGMIDKVMIGNVAFTEFDIVEDRLQLTGDGTTAVTTGVFRMKGSAKVRFRKSGRISRRDISGLYRTTHSLVKKDGKWRFVASHMNREPEDEDTLRKFFRKEWTHWSR